MNRHMLNDRSFVERPYTSFDLLHARSVNSYVGACDAPAATLTARQPKPEPKLEPVDELELKREKLRNEAVLAASARRHRKQTYIAQAFILFNVWGIPLSYGPYLEFYRTGTWLESSTGEHLVLKSSFIIAIQLLCIFGAGVPALVLYQHKYRFSSMIAMSITVSVCQWALMACKTWRSLILVQGLGVGVPLGVLNTMGTLVLGSHFKNNHPLSSMVSVSAGFVGAIVYTTVSYAWLCSSSTDRLRRARCINASITTVTLGLACILCRRSSTHKIIKKCLPPHGHRTPLSEPGTLLFLAGYILFFAALFIYPLYSILLLSNPPSHTLPATPTWHLILTYTTAMFTVPCTANKFLRTTLGPVNTLLTAAIVAAACLVAPAWTPYPYVALPVNAIYGVALGATLALHTKALSVFHWSPWSYHDDMVGRAAVCHVLVGAFVAAGVVWTAWVVEMTGVRGRAVWRGVELGFGVGWTVGASFVVVGVVFMAVGRWRRCPGVFVVV